MKKYSMVGLCVFLCGIALVSFAQMPSSGGSTPAASGGSVFVPSSGGGSSGSPSSTGDSTSSTGGGTPPSSGGGTGGGNTASPSGNPAPAVSDSSSDDYSYFDDFQNDVQNARKKKVKKKKEISVFDNIRDILRMKFMGNPLGDNWRVNGVTTNNPTAHGTLTGKGSLLRILIGLYTGFVDAQFDSKISHWFASFYSEGDAQRANLYNGKTIYQKETTFDVDGVAHEIGLLLTDKTLFGTYEDGSFFIVDAGMMPDAAPAASAGVFIPQGSGPLIPTGKIIEMLQDAGMVVRALFVSVAHAATQALTPSQTFAGLGDYKRIKSDMARIEEQFNAFNFDDPDVDLDAAQALVDAYDAKQNQLYAISSELGWRGQPFVRDGAWLTAAGSAATPLLERGVSAVPAIFMSELSGPFDFYIIPSGGGAQAVLGGLCTGRNNADTGEEVVCFAKKVSAAQAREIVSASEKYGARADEAHGKLNDIEAALFAAAQ